MGRKIRGLSSSAVQSIEYKLKSPKIRIVSSNLSEMNSKNKRSAWVYLAYTSIVEFDGIYKQTRYVIKPLKIHLTNTISTFSVPGISNRSLEILFLTAINTPPPSTL